MNEQMYSLNPLHVDSWTRYNHQKLKTRVAVEVFGNLTYESLFQKKRRVTLIKFATTSRSFNRGWEHRSFVIGKLEGDIPVFYNEVLVSFSYHNAKGELIDSFDNEPKKMGIQIKNLRILFLFTKQ